MRRPSRGFIIAVALVVLGATSGYLVGNKAKGREFETSVRALSLAQSAKEPTYYTVLLKGLRQGKKDLIVDRLEIMLDYALIHVADEYSSDRDFYGTAAKSLVLAREYRAAFPHKSSIDRTAKRVDAALALNTNSSSPR